MRQFMGQDVASARPLVPTCEIFGRHAIFGTAMVLQTNTPEFIAESQQKIVMIEMFGSEQCAGLADQFLVRGDLFGGEIEVARFVCHDIQRDFGRQFDCLEIFSGKNRGIDQSVRSEEHTSELQSLMRISYAVFCLKKQKTQQ